MAATYGRTSKKIKYPALLCLSFLVSIFGFSYLFSGAYQLGDQVFYRALYAELEHASIEDVSSLQLFYTGSSEPIYGLLAWVGSRLSIEKDIYFSVINSLFCLTLLKVLLRNLVEKLYIALSFLNFYLFVLIGPAERLKVAFFFVLLAMVVPKIITRVSLLAAALLSHFQIIIVIGSWLASLTSRMLSGNIIQKIKLIKFLLGGAALSISCAWFFSAFSSELGSKFEAYHANHGIASIFSISLLAAIAIVILKKRLEVLLSLFATGVAASFVGSERVNMIAFFLFSFFVIKERRAGHPLVIALMVYFAVKGVIFVTKVFLLGTGF